MAKQKFITRTITTVRADFIAVTTDTEEVLHYSVPLPTYCTTEKLAMTHLKSIYKHTNVVVVKITKLDKEDKLYRMTEDLFTVYGEEISHR